MPSTTSEWLTSREKKFILKLLQKIISFGEPWYVCVIYLEWCVLGWLAVCYVLLPTWLSLYWPGGQGRGWLYTGQGEIELLTCLSIGQSSDYPHIANFGRWILTIALINVREDTKKLFVDNCKYISCLLLRWSSPQGTKWWYFYLFILCDHSIFSNI